ncbi:hypothetical protein LTR95_008242 [Oleoguttula sp. CCFEE 5521]
MYFLSLTLLFVSLISPSLQASLQDTLASHPNLTSFAEQLGKLPGILDRLESSDTPLTILAPDNAAMAKTIYYPVLGPAFQSADPEQTRFIMQYHVLPGKHTSDMMNSTFQYYSTWLDNSTYANVTGGQKVGGVIQAGAIPQMVWTSGFSSRSIVREADIEFDGGVLHIIDSLVIPPTSFPDTASRFSLAVELYGLNSFVGAMYTTPNTTLASLLNTTTDVTIFAPNNVAMESVTPTITDLSNATLQDLLAYHVVLSQSGSGSLFSTSFGNDTTITTLQGASLTLTFSSNSWFVNSARIINQDLLLSNGVMHVLDNVLSPNATNAQPVPASATQAPVLQTTLAAEFNSSMAPFTTNLPNAVVTTEQGTDGYVGSVTVGGTGGGAIQTSRPSSSSGSGGSSSGAVGGRVGEIVLAWTGIVVLGLALLMG